jgi:hypothetical protein
VEGNTQLRRSKEHPLRLEQWPAKAQAIIRQAGLEPDFRDLLEPVKTPR